MRFYKAMLIVFVSMCFLFGCQKDATQTQNQEKAEPSVAPQSSVETEPVTSEMEIHAAGRTYTVKEIQEGILRAINTELYYSGDKDPNLNKDYFLNKNLEYDLVFEEDQNPPYVLLIFNNMDHPLSTEEKPKYCFGIAFTDLGMEEKFYTFGTASAESLEYETEQRKGIYLGNYSFCVREITEPQHEQMSDEWKRATEAEIRAYMNENDFYVADKEKNLQPGKYQIYVQGFGKGDEHSRIFFEHESGRIYEGLYYFVHENDGERAADLNHVCSDDYDLYGINADYYEKVKLNAALQMDYSI